MHLCLNTDVSAAVLALFCEQLVASGKYSTLNTFAYLMMAGNNDALLRLLCIGKLLFEPSELMGADPAIPVCHLWFCRGHRVFSLEGCSFLSQARPLCTQTSSGCKNNNTFTAVSADSF